MPLIEAEVRISHSGIVDPPAPYFSLSVGSPAQLLQWPIEIQFGGLLHERLCFIKPLIVKLYKDQNVFVAECIEIDQFGSGENMGEALDDLGRTLSEMYFYLSGSEKSGTLGDSLIQQFGALKTFVALRQSSPVAA